VEPVLPDLRFANTLLGKIEHYHAFRRRAWRLVGKEDPDALLWVAKIDTAMALGKRLLEKRYVLTLQELHDKYRFYQKAIRLYASHAGAVVVPEYCRANILRCWHGLNRTPFVLPNKPLVRSGEKHLFVSDANARSILESIPDGNRILLYQGAVTFDRDLGAVARAVQELGEGYRFVIMGPDRTGDLTRLREMCPPLVHIPWVRPPAHLEITSHAHVGIAFYKFDSLNSIFCAPNKIWEYSAFGVPTLCQDIPGLRYTIGTAGAGVCVDSQSVDAIISAVRIIEANYSVHSQRAREFYESVDTTDVVGRIIDHTTHGGPHC